MLPSLLLLCVVGPLSGVYGLPWNLPPNFRYRPEWDSLRVKWGLNIFSENNFRSLPRKVSDAHDSRFALLRDECQEIEQAKREGRKSRAKFAGRRYWKNNDPSVVLIYDTNGYVAGMQTAIPKKILEKDGEIIKSIGVWKDDEKIMMQSKSHDKSAKETLHRIRRQVQTSSTSPASSTSTLGSSTTPSGLGTTTLGSSTQSTSTQGSSTTPLALGTTTLGSNTQSTATLGSSTQSTSTQGSSTTSSDLGTTTLGSSTQSTSTQGSSTTPSGLSTTTQGSSTQPTSTLGSSTQSTSTQGSSTTPSDLGTTTLGSSTQPTSTLGSSTQSTSILGLSTQSTSTQGSSTTPSGLSTTTLGSSTQSTGQSGTPTFLTGTPTHSTGTPTQSTGTPTHSTITPILFTETPTLFTGTPTHSTGTPMLFTETPSMLTGTPTHSPGTPTPFTDTKTLFPATSSPIPGSSTTFHETRTHVSGTHNNTPETSFTNPQGGSSTKNPEFSKDQMEVLLKRPLLYPYVEDEEFLFFTVYFIKPERICNPKQAQTVDEVEHFGTGSGFYMQNGTGVNSVIEIPRDEQKLQENHPWKAEKCFWTQGKIYSYNFHEDQDCKAQFPLLLNYNKGRLTGFAMLWKMDFSSPNLEHPDKGLLKYMFEKVPKCYKGIGRLTKLQVYFTNHFLSHRC